MSTKSPKIETSNPTVEADMSRAATDLAVWQTQAVANTRALAQQLGYDGLLSPEFLQQGIIESMERIGSELHTIGARLLLLREQCSHGEFLICLEKVEITPRGAQKIMQVALKFPNTPTLAHLQKLGRSKLFELVLLDDDVLEVLEHDGTVLGYKVDELEQMSVREMRAKLREALANNAATDRLLAAKDKKLNELSRKGQAVGFTDGVHVFSTLIEQIDAAKRQLKASYAEIDICISAALEVEGDEVDREGMNAAQIALAQCIKDALDEPERMLQKVGKRFEDTIALLADEAAK
ncbi:MAG: hypothetical protein Q7K57_12830 [Burkholderiaceae bacterium]|nr:hypothetical protein [Burkholderiaceae bacterium]